MLALQRADHRSADAGGRSHPYAVTAFVVYILSADGQERESRFDRESADDYGPRSQRDVTD